MKKYLISLLVFLAASSAHAFKIGGLNWLTADGAANSCVKTDGSGNLGWMSVPSVASPSTSIQFNSSGSLAGNANLEWDNTKKILKVIGNQAASCFIGENAGNANSTGDNNTFIGSSSGKSNQTGNYNTYLGVNAGYSANSSDNTFIGALAGQNNKGKQNTAVGSGAGYAASGDSNTLVGFGAGSSSTGQYNTSIGTNAGYSTTGNSNVFLGYEAGYNETGSNKLYISNSSAAVPLIGGDFSAATVSIMGELRLNGTGSGFVGLKGASAAGSTTYTLPTADGSANAVISTNASGTLSWISRESPIPQASPSPTAQVWRGDKTWVRIDSIAQAPLPSPAASPSPSLQYLGGDLTFHALPSASGGNVYSTSTGTEQIERVKVGGNCTAAGTPGYCTILQKTNGIASVQRNNAVGDYTLNFVSGTFSAAPTCTGSGTSVGVGPVFLDFVDYFASASATVTRVTMTNWSNSAGLDAGFSIICVGPH